MEAVRAKYFVRSGNTGAGLTFEVIHPIFRLFHCSAHSGVTHTKIFTHLGECIKGGQKFRQPFMYVKCQD